MQIKTNAAVVPSRHTTSQENRPNTTTRIHIHRIAAKNGVFRNQSIKLPIDKACERKAGKMNIGLTHNGCMVQ